MVSYKVLIILTVLFIINCDCDDEIKQKVQDTLKSVGFSEKNSFVNFLIVQQFEDLPEFRQHLKKYTENLSQSQDTQNYSVIINSNIIKQYFNWCVTSQDYKPISPKDFCKPFNCEGNIIAIS
ncbi:uncharacterized protein LOC114131727 [Aphis gossypii]|uniref:uncharacterized protein LOC114131727 n=1 Tax=Aphis gossypii TaxID=80765 RepID=UPI00215919A6|nr:uncharacterized protein LOC114131727 [Aphis gossypii]